MKKFLMAAAILMFLSPLWTRADEGMWLLSLVEKVNMDEMREMGLQLDAGQIYNVNQGSLKDAIGALDYGSCTAVLVSPDGLLFSNHHCAYDEIQYHSSLEHDYLKKGFWAMSKEEELPNEGKTITFLVRMEEVSDQILPKLREDMDVNARNAMIRSLSSNISMEAIAGTNYDAAVESMYKGNRFFLFVTVTYRDVRLVGAPPESIGKYGGDTDNWVWPRHTCDFSMFRVYTGPGGEPADYHPDNIPLESTGFLPVSLNGYQKGDFTMVMGFPGSTDRYMTSWEVEELLDLVHPNRIRIRGLKQELMMEDMMADEKVRIQYAAKYTGSSNYWKYSIGQSKGLERLHVVEKERSQEQEFSEWISGDDARMELYGTALNDIKESVSGRRAYKNAEQYLMETVSRGRGMESVYFARYLEVMERTLAYEGRDPEDLEWAREMLRPVAADFYKDYHAPTDRKIMTAMIQLLLDELDDEFLPDNILEVKYKYKGNVKKYVDRYFKKSFVTDSARFAQFLERPSLRALRKDPAYRAHMDAKIYLEVRGKLDEFQTRADGGSRLYMKGLMEMQADREFYSDANSTMRLNYGSIGDYFPRDAVFYKYFTTLKGVMEKEDPASYEFRVPEKLKELYETRDFGSYGEGDRMYVCFTSDNDITGGNSGSPVMNDRGELIGLAFDGNWEAMSGDIAFETELQKCINVDIRYVLFIIDKFAGAGHLVEEMTLVK